MTKSEIESNLFELGIRSQYSGREKCYYVNKLPDEKLLKKFESFGFRFKIWSAKRISY